jgi:hypothetical protein
MLDDPARSAMYEKGVKARADWENWYEGLAYSAYRDGAAYWAGERSNPNPVSCKIASQGYIVPSEEPFFTEGCEATRIRLAPIDVLRKSNADYKLGWSADPLIPYTPATPLK